MNQTRTEILKMIKFLRSIGEEYIKRETYPTCLVSNSEYTLKELIDIANAHGVSPENIIVSGYEVDGCSGVDICKVVMTSDASYHNSLKHLIINAISNHWREIYIKLSGNNCYMNAGRVSLISFFALKGLAIPDYLKVDDITKFNVDELLEFAKQVFETN